MRKFNKPNFGSRVSKSRDGNRDSRPSSGRRSGGTRFGGDRSETKFSRPASGRSSNKSSGFELYEVTCDRCGIKCDIPFKPTTNKPVYCRSCFRKNESEPRRDFDKFESRNKEHPESRPKFKDDFRYDNRPNKDYELSDKDSKISSDSKPSSDDLEKINRKLDKIMKALNIE